jgi:hypothetical protein
MQVVLIIVLAVTGASQLITSAKNKNLLQDPANKRHWVLNQTNSSYDYAILGSSRANKAFILDSLNAYTNQSGINIATDGSGYLDNIILFSEFLQSNKVNKLYLAVDVYSLDAHNSFSTPFHEIDFVLDSQAIMNHYLASELGKMKYSFMNNYNGMYLIRYNTELYRRVANNLRSKPKYKPLDLTKNTSIISDQAIDNLPAKKVKLNVQDKKNLIQILDLCKKEGIEVVAFNSPELQQYAVIQENRLEVKAEIKKILKEQGVSYFDDTSQNSQPKFFKDKSHLNYNGMLAYTKKFSEYINQ